MNKIFIFIVATHSIIHLNAQSVQSLESARKDRFIKTNDNVRLFVKESGTGPACIFIHGGPGAWSKSFEDLGGENLESHLKMIYYDQRGSGRSENASDGNYSLNRMVADIEEIRVRLKADNVYLMSHSFGGILAVNYALRYPQRVKGMILVNSTLDLLYSISEQTKYINDLLGTNFTAKSKDSVIQTFLKANKVLSSKGLAYKRLSDIKQNVERVDRIDRSNFSNHEFGKEALLIKDYLRDYSEITPNIKCPVLVISGKKDHAIGVDHYMAFDFPDQTIVKINGGHILYYEKNKRFVKAVFSFLNRSSK